MKLIRFLLSYGHVCEVAETPQQADVLVRRWQSGEMRQKDTIVGGVDQLGRQWAFLANEVVGVVSQDMPAEMELAVRQQLQGRPAPGITFPMSGRN